ncbi:MAG: hypothetical protein KF886_10925 [Candidatus Hydrogenedentes bacterium]|nr:hypothetical protein [Candidatus Hydrogenedentota bacterium]
MFGLGLVLALTILLIVLGAERFSGYVKRGFQLIRDLHLYIWDLNKHVDELREQARRSLGRHPVYQRNPETYLDPVSAFVIFLVFLAALLFFVHDSGVYPQAWLTPFGPD